MPTCLVVEHVPAERPFLVADALHTAGVHVDVRGMWSGISLPTSLDGFDGLVVMGGPMSARSDEAFPWRTAELRLLGHALREEVPTLGVCLGAQLLAAAAGGTVVAGEGLEVGWGPVEMQPPSDLDPLFGGLPQRPVVLHWHGETVETPAGAVLLASNHRYRHQAFRIGRRGWGLQFHLEVDAEAVESFVAAFPDEAGWAPGGAAAILERTPSALAELRPFSSGALGRFADLVAAGRGGTPDWFGRDAVTRSKHAVTKT